MSRDTYLGGPEFAKLDQACIPINKAFGALCFLVGSANVSREFRDVDVRLILNKNDFEGLFGSNPSGEGH